MIVATWYYHQIITATVSIHFILVKHFVGPKKINKKISYNKKQINKFKNKHLFSIIYELSIIYDTVLLKQDYTMQ